MLTRPLLAAKPTDADLQRMRYPVLVSPKIDGIRALVVGGKLLSRSMKLIPNHYTQNLFGLTEHEGLDGELVVGNPWDKNVMQQTTSGVMTHGGQPKVTYWVFDKWDEKRPYKERLDKVHLISAYYDKMPIISVQHTLCCDYESLIRLETEYLHQGYEGAMIRSLDGRYKQNRSTVREGILLKLKRFQDSEAKVLEYEPLYRNANAATLDERGYTKRSTHQDNKIADDLLGSLLVQDVHSGVIFNIGSGFTLPQRQELWDKRGLLVGSIIKYKSFSIGTKDKPRFPIFLGFRSTLDM